MGTVIDTGLTMIGARSEFMLRLAEAQAYYKDLATRCPARTKTEEYRWIGQTAYPRSWGAGRQTQGLVSERYSISDEKYESTLEIDREEIEDDQTGQIRIRIQELAEAHESFKDFLIAQLLINGGTAGFVSYDGVTFFNESHPCGTATNAPGVQSNDLTFAAASGTAPTVQEFLDSYNQAVTRMFKMLDDRNNPMMLNDKGLIVVVPPDLRPVASQALRAAIINNTTNVFADEARLAVFPWLTDATKWYLVKANAPIRPFIFQDRIPVEFSEMRPDSEHAFKTDKILCGTRARYGMAYGRYEFCMRTTFT